MDWFLICTGLALLFFGGEATLRASVSLARLLGVSPAMIGLTVIGFGTSMPELVVTLQASLNDQDGLALGNVIGSNIANIFLILGLAGLLVPLSCAPKMLRRDGLVLLLCAILLCALALSGEILRWQGAAMAGAMLLFVGLSWLQDRREQAAITLREQEAGEVAAISGGLPLVLLVTGLGLAALIGGAHLLVSGAVGIATGYGVPESVIGLTLLALGTSLPELTAALVAARRGHGDVAVANVSGSFIFNSLFILGVTVTVAPLSFTPDLARLDVWVMLASAVLLLALLRGDHRICRRDALLLLVCYSGYCAALAARVLT